MVNTSTREIRDAVLFHRNTAFTVGSERAGHRTWKVFAADGPIGSGAFGVAQAEDSADSFRVAVAAAQAEIDRILGDKRIAK